MLLLIEWSPDDEEVVVIKRLSWTGIGDKGEIFLEGGAMAGDEWFIVTDDDDSYFEDNKGNFVLDTLVYSVVDDEDGNNVVAGISVGIKDGDCSLNFSLYNRFSSWRVWKKIK